MRYPTQSQQYYVCNLVYTLVFRKLRYGNDQSTTYIEYLYATPLLLSPFNAIGMLIYHISHTPSGKTVLIIFQ
jgi:uncharacterized membrane protein